MRHRTLRYALAVAVLGLLVTSPAWSEGVSFEDPTGDDNGPGNYVYPTDAVYTPGSFDITGLDVTPKGKNLSIDVSIAGKLDDPWRMGVGFAVQMIFVFVDTDGKADSGFTEGLPGLNITFAPESAWDKVIVMSPQTSGRVRSEAEAKVSAAMMDAVVVPTRVRGSGQKISTQVKLADLGDGDPAQWGWQVVMQSNEGFPKGSDLLTRKVNEFEGQHRFGGGTDYDCDPHAMDILAGKGEGKPEEVELQHKMLAYECDAEGNAKKMATLEMVRK